MATGLDKFLASKTSSPEFRQSADGWHPRPIVSVGNDMALLSLREQVMKGAGLAVQSVMPDSAEGLAHSSDSQVWVFCNTVEAGSLLYLASAVRRYSPDSRMVLLEGPWPIGPEAALFDRILDLPNSIELLVATVYELAREESQSDPHASESTGLRWRKKIQIPSQA